MIPAGTRSDIIADRFAYAPDETVLVNASQLCSEIIEHDLARHEIKQLRSQVALLVSFVHVPATSYRYIDLKA